LRGAFRHGAGVSWSRSLARLFHRAQREAERFRLKKSFRTLINDTITNTWEGEWQDAESGAVMRGFGVEVWAMRDGKIAAWEAAFNSGRADQTNSVVPRNMLEVLTRENPLLQAHPCG
jgi:hypothetical protein